MDNHTSRTLASVLHPYGSVADPPKISRDEPSAEVIDKLRFLVRRSRRSRGVPLARLFVRREDASGAVPPLALLLRGGQGGEVRLKLYLTMTLLAVQPPFDIRDPIPARSWAAAMDLNDPERKGARRIGDAITWLAQHKFIVTERRQGTPGSIRLLSQDLSGSPYSRPTPEAGYVLLPLGLWNTGWIVRLSGTALVIMIVLLDMQGGRAEPQWISPAQARRRYDLSTDTWTKGLKELRESGLVTITRRAQGNTFNYKRVRNAYWLHEELLNNSPVLKAPDQRQQS